MTTSYPSKEAILRYLEARFELEPLPHYAMVAIKLCDSDEPLPEFARDFLTYVADRFFTSGFDDPAAPAGKFPQFTSNHDKAGDQWSRAEDCILFLSDLKAAMEKQQERLELVQWVENSRRERKRKRKSYEKIFYDLEDYYGEPSGEIRRRWETIVRPKQHLGDEIPVALMPDGEIITRKVKART